MDKPTKVEVGQRWKTPGGQRFTIRPGMTSAIVQHCTLLGWDAGYGPQQGAVPEVRPEFIDITYCTGHQAVTMLLNKFPSVREAFMNVMDYVANGYKGEAVRLPINAATGDFFVVHADSTVPSGRLAFDVSAGPEAGKAPPAHADNCADWGGYACSCGLIPPKDASPKTAPEVGKPPGWRPPHNPGSLCGCSEPPRKEQYLNHETGGSFTYKHVGNLTALEAIRSRKPPAPWAPSIDEWDLLPDAGR